MNLRTASPLIATALLSAGASTAQPAYPVAPPPEVARALEGRTPGAPVNCISHRAKMHVVDDWTILFRDRGVVYVQRPYGGCHGLANGMSLIRDQFGTTQLCRGDINQVVDLRTGFGTGACSYSEFIPYRKAG